MHRSSLALFTVVLASCVEQPTLPPPPPPNVAPPTPELATMPAQPQAQSRYPATAKRPVINDYHSVKVTDDYQWLEKAADPEVQAWIADQGSRTRAYFDAIPGRKPVRDEVSRILLQTSADWFAMQYEGSRLFALKVQPPKQQPFLVMFKTPEDLASERVIVDPAVIDSSGRTAIDWYEVSPDKKYVAVSLSQGGTENGTVHVYNVETGKETGDIVTYAHSGTAGGSLTWQRNSSGFFYTRHPHPGERPATDMGFFQQVYFHKLGTKEAEDQYSIGKDFPRIAEIELSTSGNGKFTLASVQNGDGGEYWQYLLNDKGQWTKFADLADKVVRAKFGQDNKLYLLSNQGAPKGKILRLDPAQPDLAKAETVVAESKTTISSYTPTNSRLFVVEQIGGPSQVQIYDLKGKSLGLVPTLPVSSIGQLLRLSGDDVLFRNQSFTEAPAWYTHRSAKVTKTPLAMTSPVSFADTEIVREMCTSKDGTKVPLNILRRKGIRLDGTNPALLGGYGGYGNSIQPGMRPMARVWLDRGGVYAVANLRGGGEFGEAWHRAGNLTNKQNVFDDFYACAKFLVDSKHTRPQRLAIVGGSNGGLLMGAALTQHPEMYKAVVSFVGIYDMLRVELTTNGAFNTTEFGSVKDPQQFKALYAYSPLHNVKDGVAYPSVLMTSGANDPRVDAFHARKMTARLQAATTGGVVMLRPSQGGHGVDTPLDEEIEELTDMYTFLFHELDVPAPAK